MLILSMPMNQDRLNAAVLEVIRLRVMGPVQIPGRWDMYDTMQYIESKLEHSPTESGDGFSIHNKCIQFTNSAVVISPLKPCNDYEPHAPAS
jgi:hypothetical protein